MWNNYLLLHLFTFQSPFPFFFFPAFASLLQSYCAVFCRICYIFSHLLYISAPIRTLSGEFEALHSPKRILTPLQQKFPQFTASKLVKFSTRSSTRKSPKICHAFFCGIVKVRFPSSNTSQFQTRPIAKPFLRERVLFAWCLHDHFPIKGPRHSLGLKQRLCTSRKRSILVCTGTSTMIIYLSLTAETITRKEAIVTDGQACAVRRGEQCLIFPKILTYIKYHTPLLQYSHRCFSSLLVQSSRLSFLPLVGLHQ